MKRGRKISSNKKRIVSILNGYIPSTAYRALLNAAIAAGDTLPPLEVRKIQDEFLRGLLLYPEIKACIIANNSPECDSFARFNILDPSKPKITYENNPAAGAGTITYSARGWKGNVLGAFIDTKCNPSDAGSGQTQNSVFEAVFVEDTFSSSNVLSGNITSTTCTMRNANTTAQRLNSGGNAGAALDLSGYGFKCLNRIVSTDLEGFADLDKQTATIGSFTLPNETRKIFRQGAAYGDATIQVWMMGGGLTTIKQNGVRNLVNTYIKKLRKTRYLSLTPINLIEQSQPGQSNLTGRADNSTIAADLTGKVGTYTWKLGPLVPGGITVAGSSRQELELGVNNTTENLGTNHAFEMRLGKRLYSANPNCDIIKYGSGGTSMQTNWNATGGLFNEYIDTVLLKVTLPYYTYTLRRPINWAAHIAYQGEADATIVGGGTGYEALYKVAIHTHLKRLDNAGYDTSMMNWIHVIPKSGGTGFITNEYNAMVAGIGNIVSNYRTVMYPEDANKVNSFQSVTINDLVFKADGEHLNTASQDTLGNRLADIVIPMLV